MFTRVFVEHLTKPGIHLGDLAVEVREEVAKIALMAKNDDGEPHPHEQTPAYYDQTIGGRIFLAGRSMMVEDNKPVARPIVQRAADEIAWGDLQSTTDVAALRGFVTEFPQSAHNGEAKARIAALEREKAARAEVEQKRLAAEYAAHEKAQRDMASKADEERKRRAREQADREKADRERITRKEEDRVMAEVNAKAVAEKIEVEAKADAAAQAERDRAELERVARQQRENAERDRLDRERIVREQAERDKTTVNTQIVLLTPPAETPSSSAAPAASAILAGSALIIEIKKELKRVGCYAGDLDDKWASAETKSSMKKFVKFASGRATDEPSSDFLDAIRGKAERVCPLECDARQIEKGGRCVLRTCPSGLSLTLQGTCAKLKKIQDAAVAAETRHVPPMPSSKNEATGPSWDAIANKCSAQFERTREIRKCLRAHGMNM